MIPLQIFLTALIYSFILSLLAMGFTLQYITLNVPNLAYSSIAFFCTYLPLTFLIAKFSPYTSLPFAFILGGAISFLLFKFLKLLRERGMSLVGLMMATIVFDLVIYACMNIYAEYLSRNLQIYAASFSLTTYDFKVFGLPGILFVSAGVCISLIMLFTLLLLKTRFGIAMRAAVENYALASTHGVDVERVLAIAWFFVGGVAGVSGALYPLWFSMDPWVGARMFITIFAACVVGGIKSIYGSILGGALIAFSEIFLCYFFSFSFPWIWSYRAVISMIVAAISIVIMPHGIAGCVSRVRERGLVKI